MSKVVAEQLAAAADYESDLEIDLSGSGQPVRRGNQWQFWVSTKIKGVPRRWFKVSVMRSTQGPPRR